MLKTALMKILLLRMFSFTGISYVTILLLSFCSSMECIVSNPTVNTRLGKVFGTAVDVEGVKVNQYLGIPYAKPPINRRRFKKPEPIQSWTRPIQANKQPPACIQYTQNPFPWYDNETGKSEDCLYLNIWTPANATVTNKKSVLYWIYGGGFFIGSIREDVYKGQVLAALGDIVVVTVNYRLGSFGFLYSGSDDAPGNVGIWDMLRGLEWVNHNIEAFGGDSKNITIAGESAGSIAVGLLSVSPLAHGLYARQIMESGSPALLSLDSSVKDNLMRTQKVAEIVGCANKTHTVETHPEIVVKCLRGIPAMELSKAEASLIPHSSRSFVPQYGDEIIPKNPREAIIAGEFQCNNLLIGNNHDEGSFQITTSHPDIFGFFGEKDPHINKTLGANLMRQTFASFPATEAVINYYLPANIAENDYETIRYQVYTASGDFSLLCPTVFYAEKFAEKCNKSYFYFWTHRPSTTPWAPWMGIVHFTEVQFVFGVPIRQPTRYKAEEVDLGGEIVKIWSDFVKNGKPNNSWPLYSKQNPTFVQLDTGSTGTGLGPHKDNCDFFRASFGFT